ncbi:MAG: EutP/PduV family microcompartment system protein [Rhizobiaceae bacterium]|nr:EutP/PduV family microcompartment system protein [Rhizobiaceae bacterium]
MKRVMIIGGSGSGKTTLARELGAITGLPVVHCDKFQFREDWIRVPNEQRDAALNTAAQADEWIIEGNYSDTWPLRSSRADTIVFVDTPRYLRIWRVVSRTIRFYGKNRPDLPAGCEERFDLAFLKWTWSFDKNRRPNALKLIHEARSDQVAKIFKNIRDSEEWLAELKGKGAGLSP